MIVIVGYWFKGCLCGLFCCVNWVDDLYGCLKEVIFWYVCRYVGYFCYEGVDGIGI